MTVRDLGDWSAVGVAEEREVGGWGMLWHSGWLGVVERLVGGCCRNPARGVGIAGRGWCLEKEWGRERKGAH